MEEEEELEELEEEETCSDFIVAITVDEKSEAIILGQYPWRWSAAGKFELPVPMARVSFEASLVNNGSKKGPQVLQDINHSTEALDSLKSWSQYATSSVWLSDCSSTVDVSMVVSPLMGALLLMVGGGMLVASSLHQS